MKWQKLYIVESLTEKYKDSVTDNDAKLSREQAARNQAESIAISRANLKVSQDNSASTINEKKFRCSRFPETDTVDHGESTFKNNNNVTSKGKSNNATKNIHI
jgi:hypothetical protein